MKASEIPAVIKLAEEFNERLSRFSENDQEFIKQTVGMAISRLFFTADTETTAGRAPLPLSQHYANLMEEKAALLPIECKNQDNLPAYNLAADMLRKHAARTRSPSTTPVPA